MANPDVQIRYILQWFQEYSELQRSDFLPILAGKYGNICVNGTMSPQMDTSDKPMSIFQIRVKFFNEWFPNWNAEQKDRFLKEISTIDTEFTEKLEALLQPSDGDKLAENSTTPEAVSVNIDF